MTKKMLCLMLGVSLLGASGCATVPQEIQNRPVLYGVRDPNNIVIARWAITVKENDLYYTGVEPAGLFGLNITDRRLTNTPDVAETDVRVRDKGFITYFAKDTDGGHWYMQPLSGDDSSRKEIDNPDSLKPKQDRVASPAQISTADEIGKYKKLLDDGIITKEEFEQKKKQLLGI